MKTTPAMSRFTWIVLIAIFPQIMADSLWAKLVGGALSMAAVAVITYWFPEKKNGDGMPTPIPDTSRPTSIPPAQ